ncbi:type II toxin-antitoxin system Phd/YefM family antitoxin [Labedella populi]|uniref:Antitoxin n=1 Tax=Labedella populi TaxID=2498850 RepID=A0A444QDX7_9MICO|nr:type II toxin-antitoxin system prevent-host-death family antitoxin [Labedella populi]RWZ67744.1 type II toxin-antitoxin system Phd/YefM family antitoxin [Labedella populi]
MDVVNMHDAKTHLSRLVSRVAAGETVVIARAGVPVARLVPIEPEGRGRHQRVGFLEGQSSVPDDFNEWASDEMSRLFDGRP